MLSYSMQHVDHHGTHHRYAKIPCYNLPLATEFVYRKGTANHLIFLTYLSAFWDMVKILGDPKAGSQWLESNSETSGSRAEQRGLDEVAPREP